MLLTVTGLYSYPVKAMAAIAHQRATVTPLGLPFDRQWLVIDESQRFVTQRDLPELARITTRFDDEDLHLAHPDSGSCLVHPGKRDKATAKVRIWKDECHALHTGEAVAEWLTNTLGSYKGGPLRLVRFPDNELRLADPKHLGDIEAPVAFADAYPFLFTNEATLAWLNEKLGNDGHPHVPMNRFRPNVVIKGLEALTEHKVKRIVHCQKDIEFTFNKPCQRCKVPTIDQKSAIAAENLEPLRTLMKNSPFPDLKGGYFGENALLVKGSGEQLEIGDQFEAEF